MKRIGLALSGGGFRATLYHLGLTRFLRDAGLLSKVTHITSVSGGSIFAAHLVLNWGRYNGSSNDFDAAAAELLNFISMDVRNRITRRFPLLLPVRWARRLMGFSNRRLTRTGLLEKYYAKYLYGDTSLFELPECPMLHILATNLSEGCLSSFSRNGLLMMRRQSGFNVRINRIHVGLATVPMAVAASSAFPGFFPPLQLTGADVGASAGEFGRHAYTDGGVFDNLGIRMFRCLERPLLTQARLSQYDFLDFAALTEAIRQASEGGANAPLRRLAEIIVATSRTGPLLVAKPNGSNPKGAVAPRPTQASGEELLANNLDHVLRHHPLQHEPLFAALPLANPEAQVLLHRANGLYDRTLELDDQLWLNRHLLEAAHRQATGRGCFRRLNSGLDGILVSDVGKPFEVQMNRRAGGLIQTAMRSTDILMDRVWQLENEAFGDTPGFVFARMTDVVEPHEDPTAPPPEVQRQAAKVRTDLDRFSAVEISSLIRHGYCIGRKACREHPELFGAELPAGAPWDPTPGPRVSVPAVKIAKNLVGPSRDPSPTTIEARALQASSLRRIWTSLPDYRDWVSYIYVPILVPMLLLTPFFAVKWYGHSQKVNRLIESISQGSPDLIALNSLLDGPTPPWVGEPAEEIKNFESRNFKGFEILQDSRIIDLRNWNPAEAGNADPTSLVYGYRRLKIRKLPDNGDNEEFRIGLLATNLKTQVRFPLQDPKPKLRVMYLVGQAAGEKKCHFEAAINFKKIPAGATVDLIYEHISPGDFLKRSDRATTINFKLEADTAEMTRWLFMPVGTEYRDFRIFQYQLDKPEKGEFIKPVTEYLADDSTILAYKLLLLKGVHGHEIQWSYK